MASVFLIDPVVELLDDVGEDDSVSIPGEALEVWTATDTDGTWGDSETCFNWTSTDVLDTAQSGRADATDATWTDAEALGEQTCDTFNRLYCFADAAVRFP